MRATITTRCMRCDRWIQVGQEIKRRKGQWVCEGCVNGGDEE